MSAVLGKINAELQELHPAQLQAVHRAMQNPYFLPIMLKLANANEDKSRTAYSFICALMG